METMLCNLGLVPYRQAHDLQLQLVGQRQQEELPFDLFLMVEHPGVMTLGRRGGREHLMVREQFLQERGIEVVQIERGGEITYHGPGQLVVYPIFSLRNANLAVTDYIARLEELMIRLAADEGVHCVRDPRNHGVWVEGKKLGSVGVAIRHGIAFHGLALNVNLSLTPFGWIRPCGLAGVEVTSLAHQTGRDLRLAQMGPRLKRHLEELFSCRCGVVAPELLLSAEAAA